MYCASGARPSTINVNAMFNVSGLGRMRKIYCKCGRIISMDSAQFRLKVALGKDIECDECRNARISRDIDEINGHFDCVDEEF